MAKAEVSGATQEEVNERRAIYENFTRERNLDRPGFEEAFCLAKIPLQPDDYDGPPRYCLNTRVRARGDAFLCKHHGGNMTEFSERPEDRKDPALAPMKHGMKAELRNLVKDFDDKDQALYDWITTSYPEAYGIDTEADPAAAYDLHRLAAEIVRAERGRGFLMEEGEVHEKEVRNEEGRVVINDDGEVVTEKSEHYLAGMMHRQDKKITDLEKELGISRKERLRHDQTDAAIDQVKSFAEIGKSILAREETEYDADAEPWNGENSADE